MDIPRKRYRGRLWPKATDIALQSNVRFRGYSDLRWSAPETSKYTLALAGRGSDLLVRFGE
jgi:hypothetical protein